MTSSLTLLAIIVAALSLAFAIYLWTRQGRLVQALSEAQAKLDHYMKTAELAEKDLSAAAFKQQKLQEASTKKDAELVNWETRLSRIDEEWQKKYDQSQRKVLAADARHEHLHQQVEALTAQLAEATSAKAGRQREEMAALEEARDAAKKQSAEAAATSRTLKQDYQQLKSQVVELQKSRDSLRERLQKVDPGEFKRMKRRLHQYQYLYKTVVGLKEMADERNRNWEKALDLMSKNILGPTSKSMTFAQSVAGALEKMGSDLEVEEQPMPTPSTSSDETPSTVAETVPATESVLPDATAKPAEVAPEAPTA